MRTNNVFRGLTVAAALAVVPATLAAQDVDPEGWDEEPVDVGLATFDMEARAGVALPVGDLMEYSDPGFSAGLGGAWWLTDNVALRADGDFANLRGEDSGRVSEAATPDLMLYHYGIGVGFDVPGRTDDNAWNLGVNAGAGGTTLDTDDFLDVTTTDKDVTRSYPNLNAGAEVGRKIGENILVNLSGQLFYAFIGDNDLTQLSALRVSESIDDGISLPITLSLRWDLPQSSSPRSSN